MPNYTSQNKLNQKIGVKNYSDNRTSLEVVGRVGVNTKDSAQTLDVRGTAYISSNVGIGTSVIDDPVTPDNTSKLSVGIVSALEYYGDGSKLDNISNVALAQNLNKTSQGQLLVQTAENETSLFEYGNVGLVLGSAGPNNPPNWVRAAAEGAIEGLQLFDNGNSIAAGQTFSGINFVGPDVSVDGTPAGNIGTVRIAVGFASTAGFATFAGQAETTGIASTALTLDLENDILSTENFITFANEAVGFQTIKTSTNLKYDATVGLLTVYALSGDGSLITNLDADELQNGTIPDERFPSILPVLDGSNLTNLPVPLEVPFASIAGVATTATSAGIASTALNVTVENEETDTENFLTFSNNSTGENRLKTNSNLKFNSNNGQLSAPFFVGDGSLLTNLDLSDISYAENAGLATFAAFIATTRTIFGQSFNGSANVSGALSNVDSITGPDGDFIIQPFDSVQSNDIIIRGNNDTNAVGGGNVIIGDSNRGDIQFLIGNNNDFSFFKSGDENISANVNSNLLTQDQDLQFPDKSGTFALTDDILNGTAFNSKNLEVQEKTDNKEYQLTFIDLDQEPGIAATLFYYNVINNVKFNPSTGILTATKFGGNGSELFELNAENLTTGIVPLGRLPIVYRKESSITIDANGEGNDLTLEAGDHIKLISGANNGGGSIKFEGDNGQKSYSFKRSNTSSVAYISFEKIINSEVVFDLPGDKTGTANTFAMLDDISDGIAGTANALLIQERDNNNFNFKLTFVEEVGESESVFIDNDVSYNPSTGILTATKIGGDGSELFELNADRLTSGIIDTQRLPATYTKSETIRIDAEGVNSDLDLEGGRDVSITSIGGSITFEGNDTINSYNFKARENVFNSISFVDVLNNGTVFRLPNKSGIANTFAMLDDVTQGRTGVADNISVTNTTVQSVPFSLTFVENITNNETLYTNTNITFTPSTGILTATKIGGDGSELFELNADRLTSGIIDTQRLPASYVKQTNLNIEAEGSGFDLTLNAGDAISLEAENDINITSNNGSINFKGNSGNSSYTFTQAGTAITASISLQDLTSSSNGVVFKLPLNKTGVANTFAMIDDVINGVAGSSEQVKVQDKKSINTDLEIVFTVGASGADDFSELFVNENITYNPSQDKLTVGNIVGIGSLITDLDAENITSGQLNTNRLPASYIKETTLTVRADGNAFDLNLRGGNDVNIISDTSSIIFDADDGINSYIFKNNRIPASVTSTKISFFDVTNDGVVFKLPNKTGTANTFATLDDITQGVAGSSEQIKVSDAVDENVSYRLTLVDSSGNQKSLFSDSDATFNPNTGILTATKLGGDGSELFELNAERLTSGIIDTQRLPASYIKQSTLTVDANGGNSDLVLQSGRDLKLTSGGDNINGGSIIFEGNNVDDRIRSYTFKKTSEDTFAHLSFENIQSINNNVVFKLPNKVGTANTFAMLDDIVNGSVETAKRIEVTNTVSEETAFQLIFVEDDGNSVNVSTNENVTFTPSTGILTATKLGGDGSELFELNATNITSGSLSNDRLLANIQKSENFTISAVGSNNQLFLQGENQIIIQSNNAADNGQIKFRADGGTTAYSFSKSNDNTIRAFLNVSNIEEDEVYIFPD
jgi:hypothetical protein